MSLVRLDASESHCEPGSLTGRCKARVQECFLSVLHIPFALYHTLEMEDTTDTIL